MKSRRVGNSGEIIFLMSCLYTELSVSDKLMRSSQMSRGRIIHKEWIKK